MRLFNCVFQQCTYFISYMPWEFCFQKFQLMLSCLVVTSPYLLPDMWSPSSCSRHDKLKLQFWYLNSSANSNEIANKFEMWLHCKYLCPDLEMSDDSRDVAFCSCCRVWHILFYCFFIFKARLVCVCVCLSFYDIIENCLRLTPRHILATNNHYSMETKSFVLSGRSVGLAWTL